MIFKMKNKRRRLTISIFTLNKSTVDGLIWMMERRTNPEKNRTAFLISKLRRKRLLLVLETMINTNYKYCTSREPEIKSKNKINTKKTNKQIKQFSVEQIK